MNVSLFSPLVFCLVKRESVPASLPKPAMTEEEVRKKTNAIIEEYLHINDIKVLKCSVRRTSCW